MGIYSAVFISVRHRVEIIPCDLAVPSARGEVLRKNIFISNLNVIVVKENSFNYLETAFWVA